MAKGDSTELYELIRNLTKGIRKHGFKKVINALKEINIVSDSDRDFAIIDFIEKIVCDKIGVPNDELFNSTLRGEITIARKLCILLIRRNIEKISDENLGNHYNRTRQVIFNTEKDFLLMREGKKTQLQIDFLNLYNELDIETKDFIKTLKNKSHGGN